MGLCHLNNGLWLMCLPIVSCSQEQYEFQEKICNSKLQPRKESSGQYWSRASKIFSSGGGSLTEVSPQGGSRDTVERDPDAYKALNISHLITRRWPDSIDPWCHLTRVSLIAVDLQPGLLACVYYPLPPCLLDCLSD